MTNLSVEGEKIDSFVNASSTILGNLYCRWQDEKDYEDINDYFFPLINVAKTFDIKDLTMTKRPFGCKIELNGKVFQVFRNSKEVGWKRVK